MRSSSRPSVGLATSAEDWALDADGPILLDALTAAGVHAEPAVWDDDSVRWDDHDLVVVRSTWDYTERRDEFIAWAQRVESLTSLANPAATLAWNTDKHYLGELARAGVHVVPTTFVDVNDPPLALGATLAAWDDVVVKPTVSAGSRDTARHGPDQHDAALAHVDSLLASGKDVMVQPYLAGLEQRGETGMVHFDGEFSHAFRKGPMLVDGWARVRGSFAPEAIAAREPSEAERELAMGAISVCAELLGEVPVYARVDVIPDSTGEPILLELELTEPSFFLAHCASGIPNAASCLARHARAVTRDR